MGRYFAVVKQTQAGVESDGLVAPKTMATEQLAVEHDAAWMNVVQPEWRLW